MQYHTIGSMNWRPKDDAIYLTGLRLKIAHAHGWDAWDDHGG